MVRPLLFPLAMKLVIAAVIVAATTATALAEPVPSDRAPVLTPPSETPAAVQTTSEWYGWQILAADGAALGTAIATEHGEIALAWVGTGAAVHAAHHHYGRSFASVGLRVVLPILGASVAASNAKGCSGDECDIGAAVAGGLLGMGAAEIIDLAIASDEREVVPLPASRGWTPVAIVRHEGATVGISARF